MDNNLITLSGINLLTENEKDKVNEILTKFYNKIQIHLKNPIKIECHIKGYNIEGKRKKYSVHVRIHATRIFEADYANWDISKTLHKVVNKLSNEVEKKFHVSEQRKVS